MMDPTLDPNAPVRAETSRDAMALPRPLTPTNRDVLAPIVTCGHGWRRISRPAPYSHHAGRGLDDLNTPRPVVFCRGRMWDGLGEGRLKAVARRCSPGAKHHTRRRAGV